jgi:hypothetical protein
MLQPTEKDNLPLRELKGIMGLSSVNELFRGGI